MTEQRSSATVPAGDDAARTPFTRPSHARLGR